MFKYTVNLIFVLLFSIQVYAQTEIPTGSPVCTDTIQITLSNGEILNAICKGDSRLHWMETKYRYIFTPSKNNYYFGKIVNGEIINTNLSVSLTNIKNNKARLETLKDNNDKSLQTLAIKTKSTKTIGGVPSIGKIRIPVLLVEFSDQLHQRSLENVEAMFNQNNHNNFASLKEFYMRASHDQLEIEFDIFGWYQSDLKLEEVAENAGGAKAGNLVRKAVQLANSDGVDFSPYDNDNDGDADVVIVMHAGLGADHYGQEKYVWPRSWSLENTVGLSLNYNTKKINDYVIACEMREYNNQWQDSGIGTFAHEFGHALGLPDLYDGSGKSNGLGHWALMSAGSWLNRGIKPGNFCAWSRIKLGWDTPKSINYNDYGDYSLTSSNNMKNEVYRINTSNANEYFLLANRRKTDTDIAQPGEGLAIYHINKEKSQLEYELNDDRDNPAVRMVEADFNKSLGLYNGQDRGSVNDLFPGIKENHEFGPNTSPNSNLFNGEKSEVWIRDIQDNNGIVTFSLSQATGIISIDESPDIIVFPNPVEDFINIKAKQNQLSNSYIEIYSFSGQKLLSERIEKFTTNKQLNLKCLPQGVYLLKIKTINNIYIKKILKI